MMTKEPETKKKKCGCACGKWCKVTTRSELVAFQKKGYEIMRQQRRRRTVPLITGLKMDNVKRRLTHTHTHLKKRISKGDNDYEDTDNDYGLACDQDAVKEKN